MQPKVITTRRGAVWIAMGALSALNVGVAIYSARVWAGTRVDHSSAQRSGSAPAGSMTTAGNNPFQFIPLPNLLSQRATDGIDMASLDRFWEKWKLDDVRYRSDNGEQRFIYANEVAWQAVRDHAGSYPDGATFGKVAFFTSSDPAFPSSVETTGFSRLQIMKKDSKAYPDTDGWGYAVITAKGAQPGDKQTPAEDSQVAAACHACHRLVADRDFVFSQSPFGTPGVASSAPAMKPRFAVRAARELLPSEQKVLAQVVGKAGDDKVEYFSMPLFAGSVNEASFVVARFATDDQGVYFLSDPISGHFAAADGTQTALSAPADTCQPGTHVAYSTAGTQAGLQAEAVAFGRLCTDRVSITRVVPLNVVMTAK